MYLLLTVTMTEQGTRVMFKDSKIYCRVFRSADLKSNRDETKLKYKPKITFSFHVFTQAWYFED